MPPSDDPSHEERAAAERKYVEHILDRQRERRVTSVTAATASESDGAQPEEEVSAAYEVEVHIALFTARIADLTEHLKTHKKDHTSRLKLLRMVGKRRRLLNYLMARDIERYRAVIAQLGIRK